MTLELWTEVTAEYSGRIVKGSFKSLDGKVTVRTQYGSKTDQLSGLTTSEQLAKKLLRELAREGRA
jgi:hypothetical protein